MNYPTPKFVYGPKEVQDLLSKLNKKSIIHLLPSIVRSTRKLACPPVSDFHVSAAAVSADGQIFVGVNLEFPNLPLHNTIHAEQFLVTNLLIHQQHSLKNIVVSAYPCGHCRQFLQEIRGSRDIQICVLPKEEKSRENNEYPDEENVPFQPLSYLLPHPFGPGDLLEKEVPLVLEDHDNKLVITSGLNDKIEKNNGVVMCALEAANKSHAPYSNCPSGVAFVDVDGNVYKGSYIESAAHNPSLGPAQAAMVAFVVENGGGGGGGYERIVEGVLVEKGGGGGGGGGGRQEDNVRLFVKAVLPNCVFNVVHCVEGK